MAIVKKRPLEVEARQVHSDNIPLLLKWIKAYGGTSREDEAVGAIIVETLEGPMPAGPEWWIIRGTENEFYPCKPSVFNAVYEIVREK